MNKISLEALAREVLERARADGAGRSAQTVHGGHGQVLRQTVLALVAGAALAEHNSPDEGTIQVLSGRVRLTAGEDTWDGRTGDLITLPGRRHGLQADEDSTVLLTAAMRQP